MSQIHSILAHKKVEAVMTDGQALHIFTHDGHEVVIVWGEDGPELDRVNVRIVLPDVVAESVAAEIVGN